MATYAIGDIQGCYDELKDLVRLINFDTATDKLWFVGDLVNRGPKSLEVLRFIKDLGDNAITVLGNHDLHLIALFNNQDAVLKKHTLQEVISAPDGKELIDWLRQQPLIHHDPDLDYVMTHAGIYPFWTLEEAKKYAKEVETILQGDNYIDFLAQMYGNRPDTWDENLQGVDRARFIINAFVRMRFCTPFGKLEFEHVNDLDAAPKGFQAWFQISNRKTNNIRILFGHWAALLGHTDTPNVYALDTGCAWGNKLTAMRLEDQQCFHVNCHKSQHAAG